MSPEAEQPQAQDPAVAAQAPAAGVAPAARTAAKRPAGVPVWRTGKPDAFLAAAVETARTALEGITPAASIGTHLAAKSEGDRLVTHLFESKLAGYVGWQWYAVLTRNSRSKVVTVSELGLLPSEDSILAPEWVPWAERVRPEDEQQPDEEALDGESARDDEPAQDEAAQGDEPARDAAAQPEAADGTEGQESDGQGTGGQDQAPADDAADPGVTDFDAASVIGSDAADADFAEASATAAASKDDGGTN
jgi:hypothetical protein